ncbi:MAG: hypothetical protein IJX89_02475 [Alphaproteobacteria bacterium]|nr:hypothetical protein [Alphaproteobacteria bacterium]
MKTLNKILCVIMFVCTTLPTIAASGTDDQDCADCYYCTQYDGSNCVGECVYNETFCYADSPYNENGCMYFELLYSDAIANGFCPFSTTVNPAEVEYVCNAADDYDDCVNFLNSDFDRFAAAICNNQDDAYTASKNSGIVGCQFGSSDSDTDTEEDISAHCETMIQLEYNCARYVLAADENADGVYNSLNCDGTGTPYSDALVFAMCNNDSVCNDTLAQNWDAYTDALCFSSDPAEIADYMGYDCAGAGYGMDVGTICTTCTSGYYYDGTSSCVACPTQDGASANSTYSGYQNPIETCYMPANRSMTDTTGTYQFTYDCPYN